MKILYPLVSAVQNFSEDQKAMARSNIGAAAHSDMSVKSTTKTTATNLSAGQAELTFDITSGVNALRIFDIYADLSGAAAGTPLIEVVGGGNVINSFYAYVPVPVVSSSTLRFKLASIADTSNTLSAITIRIHYSSYLLDGGNFSVTMSEAYL